MTMFCPRRPSWLLFAFPLTAVALVAGCGKEAEIRSYNVAKEAQTPAAEPPKVAESATEPTHRMLGAILPAGDRAWFFKVVGPIAAVDKQAEAITAFFGSIQAAPAAAKPEWKLPEGWTDKGGSGMRAATLVIPTDGEPLELSVIALPSTGAPSEILSNVNRWRGQMKLPEVDERGLAESKRELKVGDATVTVVDLRGRFDNSGMTAPFAPFARGAGGAAPSENLNLPPGHPPIDGLQQPADRGAPDGNQ